MNKRPLLVIFAKAPRLGCVKTRLARHIGNGRALAAYRHMLHKTVQAGRSLTGVEIRLVVSPDHFAGAGRFWPGVDEIHPQGLGDLGRRMARQFTQHGAERDLILVGSDIPQMRGDMLAHALDELAAGHQGVFGPSEDGGFWLVGFRAGRFPRRAFTNIRWSHENTYADVRSALPPHYRIAEVETLNDIDDLSDYERYISTR